MTSTLEAPVVAPLRMDLPRLAVVSAAAVVSVVVSMVGAGVFGGPSVPEASDGALAADATLVAPGGPAFSIWSLIYGGLVAYALWQWFPAARGYEDSGRRQRRAGWWIAGSLVLNAAWLLTVRAEWLWASVVVIVVLALVLGVALHQLTSGTPATLVDRLVSDGTVGVYLGWVCVATCANVTATLVDAGVDPGGRRAEWIAVAVLAVAVVVVLAVGWFNRGNLGVGLAAAWGLAWICVERLTGAPESTLVGWAAAVAAVVALGGTVLLRTRAGGPRAVRG